MTAPGRPDTAAPIGAVHLRRTCRMRRRSVRAGTSGTLTRGRSRDLVDVGLTRNDRPGSRSSAEARLWAPGGANRRSALGPLTEQESATRAQVYL
jgi:hypothetical protein